MALRFRVEMTKTKPRISVLRIIKNEKGNEDLEPLGSFGLRKSPDLLRGKLTEDEQYELDNYLSALEFSSQYYQAEAHELGRFIIKAPVEFQEDLLKLAKLAKRHKIEFIPEKEMLLAVLNRARKVEAELCKITNKKINILAKRGINIYNTDSSTPDTESKKLFEKLLTIDKNIDKVCNDFQDIAQRVYHKNASFKPHYFENFADPANEKKFPKWYYTVAIDCLLKYGVWFALSGDDSVVQISVGVVNILHTNRTQQCSQSGLQH